MRNSYKLVFLVLVLSKKCAFFYKFDTINKQIVQREKDTTFLVCIQRKEEERWKIEKEKGLFARSLALKFIMEIACLVCWHVISWPRRPNVAVIQTSKTPYGHCLYYLSKPR